MEKFPGFPQEKQYWQFPTIINGYVNILNGNEFKVLWYILRHTFGYQKDKDAISITQMIQGIKKKDGSIVDVGTGIKQRKTVIKSLRSLEEKGFIISYKEDGKTSVYKPLVQKIHQSGVKNTPVGGVKNTPTIDNITIDKRQYNKTKKYSSLKDITEKDIKEIAGRYDVKVSFVRLQLEKLTNYCEAKGRKYKNYKSALRNFVLSSSGDDVQPFLKEKSEPKKDYKYKPLPNKKLEEIRKKTYEKLGRLDKVKQVVVKS